VPTGAGRDVTARRVARAKFDDDPLSVELDEERDQESRPTAAPQGSGRSSSGRRRSH
jgi:hypothetical protein